jgi:glycine cleavage system transcriptional repressor
MVLPRLARRPCRRGRAPARLATPRARKYSGPRSHRDGAHFGENVATVKQAGKQVTGDPAATRPSSNENYLLISAFGSPTQSPLLAISRRISDCGCNLAEARVATLGNELTVLALAQGAWDAIAKLENALARLDRDGDMRLAHFRTGARQQQSNLIPYVVEVIAADKPGVLFQLADFFSHQNITIEQLHSSRYRAMQTGADMFSAQITIGIPTTTHIAALRDDFLEFCDGLNLDAIMDPMKF